MSSGGTVAAAVAVIAAKKREELFRRFRDHGAVSPSTARGLDELDLSPRPMFHLQVGKGAIIEVGGGRYYLDELVVARQTRWRRRVLLVLAVAVVLLVWALTAR